MEEDEEEEEDDLIVFSLVPVWYLIITESSPVKSSPTPKLVDWTEKFDKQNPSTYLFITYQKPFQYKNLLLHRTTCTWKVRKALGMYKQPKHHVVFLCTFTKPGLCISQWTHDHLFIGAERKRRETTIQTEHRQALPFRIPISN